MAYCCYMLNKTDLNQRDHIIQWIEIIFCIRKYEVNVRINLFLDMNKRSTSIFFSLLEHFFFLLGVYTGFQNQLHQSCPFVQQQRLWVHYLKLKSNLMAPFHRGRWGKKSTHWSKKIYLALSRCD